jgi:beta-lactamase superfamily II metal-dependent hydrolase
MVSPASIPADRFERRGAGEFVAAAAARPSDLIYLVLNVGDADAQLLLLPEDAGARRAVIVDVGTRDKLPALIDRLDNTGLLPHQSVGRFPIVIATHPHSDHIRGIPQFLSIYGDEVSEFWDPAYYFPSSFYHQMMAEVERLHRTMQYAQPTAGLTRAVGRTRLTVLAPSVELRNRFDTFGVHVNNASLVVKVESPIKRVTREQGQRVYTRNPTAALVLGADAQTLSWGRVMFDFPNLERTDSTTAGAARLRAGAEPLSARVLKISHHASKQGVNLELVHRVGAKLMIVSCRADEPSHYFPHEITQEILREARTPLAGKYNQQRGSDSELGLFYTCDELETDPMQPLGSIALILGPRITELWRFGDRPDEAIDLDQTWRWNGVISEPLHAKI